LGWSCVFPRELSRTDPNLKNWITVTQAFGVWAQLAWKGDPKILTVY